MLPWLVICSCQTKGGKAFCLVLILLTMLVVGLIFEFALSLYFYYISSQTNIPFSLGLTFI